MKVTVYPRLNNNYSLFPIPYSLFLIPDIRSIPYTVSLMNFVPTGRVQFSSLLPMIGLSEKPQAKYKLGETNES